MYHVIFLSDDLVLLSLVILCVNGSFYKNLLFYTLLKGTAIFSCPFASILSFISISKIQTSSPLGMEETVVKSMSEMKLKRKSVSIDTKLAAIKLLGEGKSAREVAFKLAISIETVQKKKKDLLMEGELMRLIKMACTKFYSYYKHLRI